MAKNSITDIIRLDTLTYHDGAWLDYSGILYFSDKYPDTTFIRHSYVEKGIEFVKSLNGAFSFALCDKQKLYLVCDRYGLKPLYYYTDGKILAYASTIKDIIKITGIQVEVDLEALNEYFTFQNIFTDRTLFKGIRLLPAGSYLEVGKGVTKYWDYCFSPVQFKLSREECAEELRRLFIQAVSRQLIGSKPIGCYLSGGMDTSSVATVARRQRGRIPTFTCGFDLSSASGLELGFDERGQAESLANALKTEHYEVVLHAGDMEQVMPELIYHLEDLRMGQSYPNYYISRLASKFVGVVLSGNGGDELFGGYPWRYYRGANCKSMAEYLGKYYAYWQRLVEDKDKKDFYRHDIYRQLNGHSTLDIFESMFPPTNTVPMNNESYINRSMYFEAKTAIHGLSVVDNKLSQAHSLETRVPFLDNDLADFAMKIPVSFKLDNMDKITAMDEDTIRKYQVGRGGKVIMREAMKGLIPQAILDRRKQGFSAPDASWFRGESIDYVKDLLLNPKARIYEFFNPQYVSRRLEEHTLGKCNNRLFIWSLLSFEWWNRIFRP